MGVNVMITIFGGKIGVFLKANCHGPIFLHQIAVFLGKNAYVLPNFSGEI
jgi:hypothetical protein